MYPEKLTNKLETKSSKKFHKGIVDLNPTLSTIIKSYLT